MRTKLYTDHRVYWFNRGSMLDMKTLNTYFFNINM